MKYIILLILSFYSFNCNTEEGSRKKNDSDESIPSTIPSGALPIKYENGRIYISGLLNDTLPVRFMIDNGAPELSLDSTLIAENSYLDIKVADDVILDLQTPMGDIQGQICTGDLRFSSNNWKLEFGMGFITNKKRFFYADSIVGALPMHKLQQKKYLEINLKNKYINSRDSIDLTEFIKIPFQLAQSKAFIIDTKLALSVGQKRININGSIVIDYGYPRKEIIINSNKCNNQDFKLDTIIAYDVINLKKVNTSYSFICDTIHFNSIAYKCLNTPILFKNLDKSSPGGFISVLGTKFLEHFNVVIDYKEKILYLNPFDKTFTINQEHTIEKWGFGVYPEQYNPSSSNLKHKWLISKIIKGKEADKQKISLTDEVISINGVSTKNLAISSGRKLLEIANEIQIKTKDNKIIKLKYTN